MRRNNALVIAIFAFLLLCSCLALDVALAGVVAYQRLMATAPPAAGVPEPAATPTLALSPARMTPGPVPVPGLVTPAAPPSTPGPGGAAAAPAGSGMQTLRQLQNAVVPLRDLYDLGARLKKLPQPIPRLDPHAGPPPRVGDRQEFWVSNQSARNYFKITASLRYATRHVYMWVQDNQNLSDAIIRRAADDFENKIFPTNVRYFGSRWPGTQSVRIHILNASIPDVGGYYSSADEYPRQVNPRSNERSMFYINVDSFKPGTPDYASTLAHEFQHMIHWHEDPQEPSWVNEGLSELAVALNGYRGERAASVFGGNPDVQLNAWADTPQSSGPHYGNAYLFAAYFFQRFGEQALRDLVAEPKQGIAGFESVLKKHNVGITFDELFRDWAIANYLDDSKVGDGRYAYKDLNIRVQPQTTIRDLPVRNRETVHQYAADYFRLAPTRSGDVVITFQGSPTVKLVDNEPHSGRYEWYSNRGDASDTTLTRAFDLTGVQSASLEAWVWYDLEEDWDYAYIEVSTDGGKTWDILRGQHTRDTNPNGNSFGHAWTGKSGNGKTPRWVQEKIDLRPYAGQKIQLRFEVITDDSTDGPGFAVDDVVIPEINYRYDAEAGDDGWEARGFIRTDNILPERFVAQLIEVGQSGTAVRQLPIDEQQRGQWTVKGFSSSLKEAILVIAAQAPTTTELASYEWSAETASQ